jgi:hypothetical protein
MGFASEYSMADDPKANPSINPNGDKSGNVLVRVENLSVADQLLSAIGRPFAALTVATQSVSHWYGIGLHGHDFFIQLSLWRHSSASFLQRWLQLLCLFYL